MGDVAALDPGFWVPMYFGVGEAEVARYQAKRLKEHKLSVTDAIDAALLCCVECGPDLLLTP